MSIKQSLVGQVFYDLTVIGDAPSIKGVSYSICICSCGQECIKRNKYLKNGDTKSCGHRYKNQKQPDFYPGQVFGSFSVIRKLPMVKGKKPRYLVECSCGNIVEKSRKSVITSTSCGACQSFSYIGKKIDRLTIIAYLGTDKKGKQTYEAICDCGTKKTITYSSLRKNKYNSCNSCYSTWSRNLENLSGNVLGRLTILYLWQSRPNLWLSICECGKTTLHSKSELLGGNVQSCGCLQQEYRSGRLTPYKGSSSVLNIAIRSSKEYRTWKLSVYTRDNNLCQECPKPTKGTVAHHIVFLSHLLQKYNITSLDEARSCSAIWDVTNGITLCDSCHASKHPLLQSKFNKMKLMV